VSHERLAGYREALSRAGVAYDPRLVASGDFTEEAGYEGIEALLRTATPFTAVFAANDLAAIGATAALRDGGRRVPEDVSVVGFDDIRLAAYTSPALTTIRQPTYEMGRRATELLIDAVHGRTLGPGQQVVFEGELIVRASSRPMAAAQQAETV
jgi:DNA-binding LacI/PurR family transcriptional regulator